MRQRRVAEKGLEITIPTMDWEQIGGDMDPGTYGGTIATGDGHTIELIKIQPVREYVGALNPLLGQVDGVRPNRQDRG